MKGWARLLLLLSIVAAGCGPSLNEAPPAMVAFENGLFRILDVNVPPGTASLHAYENDVATVVMRDGAHVRTSAPGGEWVEVTASTTGNVSLGEAGEHEMQNLGETAPFQVFALENLREGGEPAAEPASHPDMTLSASSPSFAAYDARLADNTFQIQHVHATPTVAVLIRGRIFSQGPESKDAAVGAAPTGLKQLDQPGQWLFVPAGEPHYVVRLGADPAHIVEIELR